MSLLFVGGHPEFIRECKAAAAKHGAKVVGEAASPYDIYILVDRVKPDGVLVTSQPEWVNVAIDIARVRPNALVFVSGPVSAATWSRMSEARVYSVPADPEQAVRACVAALGRLSPQRVRLDDLEVRPPEVAVSQRAVAVPARTVVVYSNKGGAGKTTLAENLAAVLGLWAREQERATGMACRVALLDFNVDGSTGLYTWFPPGDARKPKTAALWEDFASGSAEALPWAAVSGVMNYSEGANVYYLAPPQTPDEKERFNRELAKLILEACQRFFHFVIVDSGVALKDRDPVLVAVTRATDVLLVCRYTFTDLRLLAEGYSKEFGRLLDPAKTGLVLNRVRQTWFTVRDFVEAFTKEAGTAVPLKGELPEEPGLESKEAQVAGVPYVCVRADSEFSRAVCQVARNVLGVDVALARAARKGLRERLLSLFGGGRKKKAAS
ncbi:AAA family ATPase [Desulfovirgula thermocuniculi]|uniref:AAA family ATPase n=1 Tax=Desulfovirgula thermocuniculi TaxID=348842 RepID=UPI00042773D3|nr:hypothetical protein [Desulfovirgula thermocuniculi]